MGIIRGGLIESINLEQNPRFPGRQSLVCGSHPAVGGSARGYHGAIGGPQGIWGTSLT